MMALFRNIRPKCSLSGNISSCMGKYTPAESTRYMMGKRFSIAISCARRFFFPVIGNHAPAFTVASFATTIHCLPATYPITTTTPAPGQPPCSLYIPYPAIAPISTRSVFGSSSKSIRSLAVSLPASCSLSMRFFPPPR